MVWPLQKTRPMERLFKLIPLLFLLAACGRSPGFKAEDYDYRRVQAPEKTSEKAEAAPQAVSHPGSIVRFSNKITFAPTETKWDQDQVKLKAKVQFADQSFGEVELQGVKKDSKILLTTSNPEINQKLKAQIICTSEGDNCEEFFIDVFYMDKDVIYQDQVIPTLKNEPAKAEEKKETKPAPESKPAPKADAKEAKKNTERDHVQADMRRTVVLPSPFRPKNKEPEKISDGVPGEVVEKTSYVGTSDEEIRQIYEIPPPVKTPPVKTEIKESPPTPVPAPTGQSAPPKVEARQQAPVKEAETAKQAPVQQAPVQQSAPPQNQQAQVHPLDQFRERDQVIGSPSAGRLNKGTDFLKISQLPGFAFFIVNPRDKDYFASFDMAVVMKKLSEVLQSLMPGRRLAVTSMSKWGGGRLPPHDGHQNGTDADFRYLTNDESKPSYVVSRGRVNNTLLVNHQWKFFKKAFQTELLDVIFVDKAVKRAMCEEARRVQDLRQGENDSVAAEVLKRIQPWDGHANHFHVRIKCSSDNPRCKQVVLNYKTTGC